MNNLEWIGKVINVNAEANFMSLRYIWLDRDGWRVASLLFGKRFTPPPHPWNWWTILCTTWTFTTSTFLKGDMLDDIHCWCLTAVVGLLHCDLYDRHWSDNFFWSVICDATEPYSPLSLVLKETLKGVRSTCHSMFVVFSFMSCDGLHCSLGVLTFSIAIWMRCDASHFVWQPCL